MNSKKFFACRWPWGFPRVVFFLNRLKLYPSMITVEKSKRDMGPTMEIAGRLFIQLKVTS